MTIQTLSVVQRGLTPVIDGITTTVVAIAAPYAPQLLMYGTSDTENYLGTGDKTYLLNENNSGFSVGQRVRGYSIADETQWLEGIVTHEQWDTDGHTITVTSDLSSGAGTDLVPSWRFVLTGERGAIGPKGDTGATGPQGLIDEPPNDSKRYVRRNNLGTGSWIDADAAYQPKDADLTSLAGATAFGSATPSGLYYRKAADTWAPLNIGVGLALNASTDTLSAPTGGGNVGNVGTPANGMIAQWTDATHIQGINIAALGLQPQDGDLTSLAAASTFGIYQRSAADTWTPVSIDTASLVLSGGTLSAKVAEAGVGGIPYCRQSGGWADASLIFATLSSPSFTGDPRAPTPPAADNDTSIATTAWVNSAIAASTAFQPIDPDLTSLAGASASGGAAAPSTSGLYYRKAANTWAPLKLGSGIAIDGATDTISVTAGGGNVSNVATPADNQIAVWTAPNNIEGDPQFLWNGTNFNLRRTGGNHLVLQGNPSGSYPLIFVDAASQDGSVGMSFSTKGLAPFNFYGGTSTGSNFSSISVQIVPVDGANRQLQLAGSKDSNPTITASAGGVKVHDAIFSTGRTTLLSPITVGTSSSPFNLGSEIVGSTPANASSSQSLWSGDANGPTHYLDKSRGAVGAFASVLNNDTIGSILWRGSDSSAMRNAGQILVAATGAAAAGGVPSRMSIQVGTTSGLVSVIDARPTGVAILGTTIGDDAAAGIVGQYYEARVSNVSSLPAGQWVNGLGINLGPGDWDVWGGATITLMASNAWYVAISPTSASPIGTADSMAIYYTSANGEGYGLVGPYRVTVPAGPAVTWYCMVYFMATATLATTMMRVRRVR
jgi:hypothetical protein